MDLTQLIGTPLDVAVLSTVVVGVLAAVLPWFVQAHFERTGVEAGSATRYVAGYYVAVLVYVALLLVPWMALQAIGALDTLGLLAYVAGALPSVVVRSQMSPPRYAVAREAYLKFDASESEYEDWTAAYAEGDLL